jgi:C1A family cysteine protease
MVEYFDRRAFGRLSELSALFLYQVARRLSQQQDACGADLRTAIRAMVEFGAPPEEYWAYDPRNAGESPDALLYSFAQRYRSILYLRLDGGNRPGADTLRALKLFLAAGFPVAFGFAVPSSLGGAGDVPYRPTFDSVRGGQAAIAAGYDDSRLNGGRGAVLIRCSWGTDWGDEGYGWLPYVYVEEQLATDFWTFIKRDWCESGEFARPYLGGQAAEAER